MNEDLERMLRDSLRTRADDVEPTPYLFEEIRGRVRRRRRAVRLAAAAGFAVAAVFAVVVVPGALDLLRPADDLQVVDAPGEQPDPTATPEDEEDRDADAPARLPSHVFVTDGTGLLLVPLEDGADAAERGEAEELYRFPEEGGSRVVALAVRPGSTLDDLTVALLTEAEGMYDLRWLRRANRGEVEVELLPEPYQLADPGTEGPVPAPVWSPDGRHLGWIERGEAGPVLRTIGWSDGPGTGRDADDDASFGFPTDLGYTHDERLRLLSWTWTESTDATARGWLALADGSSSVLTVEIERQGDGALAMAASPVVEPLFPEQTTIAFDHGAGRLERQYALSIAGAGEGTTELLLEAETDGQLGTELPTPDGLGQTNDPTSIWLESAGDGALIGSGGAAWLVGLDGEIRQLPGTVWYGDAVR